MKTLHTPAPWHLHKSESDFVIVHSDGENRSHVAKLFDSTLCEEHGSISANARLIAAAPDLLNALKALMQRSTKDAEHYAPDGNEPIWAFISDASDAIAKADGR
jgi:hypothetical protein